MKITTTAISHAVSLDEIEKLVNKCERCSLYKTKTCDVVGSGSDKAGILFIGEAPGKKEDELGEPFLGNSGRQFDMMLDSINMNRNEIYITNVLKHRPPENRDPSPTETEACWPYLRRQIELINPRLIVFLGRHALNRFFPELKIQEMHGKAFHSNAWGKDQDYLVLYHPSIYRYASKKASASVDFQQVPTILKKIKTRKELIT
jgi:DNA polymerase